MVYRVYVERKEGFENEAKGRRTDNGIPRIR